jgi:hypothetical protein
VPTKKQRRRQQKSRRHEWEYVYVDEEGQEVEVDAAELRRTRDDRQKERPSAASGSGRIDARARQGRQIQPPSWRRVGKRALILAPIFVVLMSVLNRGHPVATWILPTAFLLLFFIPFSYYTDSFAYRMYRRRLERAQSASAKAGPKPKPKTR